MSEEILIDASRQPATTRGCCSCSGHFRNQRIRRRLRPWRKLAGSLHRPPEVPAGNPADDRLGPVGRDSETGRRDGLATGRHELPNLRAQYEATVPGEDHPGIREGRTHRARTQLERQTRKFSLVAERAPQAVALAEYIPDAPDDDAQVAAIGKFLAQLGTTIQPAAVGKLPPSLQPLTGSTNLSAVDVFAQMTAALTSGNTPSTSACARSGRPYRRSTT